MTRHWKYYDRHPMTGRVGHAGTMEHTGSLNRAKRIRKALVMNMPGVILGRIKRGAAY